MKTYKKNSDISYSIGVFPTLELLQTHPDKVLRVLVSSKGETNRGIYEIETICRAKRIKMEIADKAIAKITESENAYAVGVFDKYESSLQKGNHLVLVNPSDKGNFGTIIRTMLAYDIKNLAIIRPGIDIFDPKVVRASMGAVFRLNFRYFSTFAEYKSSCTNSLYPFMTDGRTDLNKIKFAQPFSLIFGNEGAGLGPEFSKIGESVKIPQSSEVDSLNLSVAVGIGLYGSSVGQGASRM